MEQMTQKTAANSEQSASASQELDSQAGSLNEVVAGPLNPSRNLPITYVNLADCGEDAAAGELRGIGTVMLADIEIAGDKTWKRY